MDSVNTSFDTRVSSVAPVGWQALFHGHSGIDDGDGDSDAASGYGGGDFAPAGVRPPRHQRRRPPASLPPSPLKGGRLMHAWGGLGVADSGFSSRGRAGFGFGEARDDWGGHANLGGRAAGGGRPASSGPSSRRRAADGRTPSSPRHVRSPNSKGGSKSPPGRRHSKCVACDRLTRLKERSDPHTLAVLVVQLETEIEALQQQNTKLVEQVGYLEACHTKAVADLSTTRTRNEMIEDTLRSSVTKLLEVQLEKEAASLGIKDKEEARAYAKAESPKRLRQQMSVAFHESAASARSVSSSRGPGAKPQGFDPADDSPYSFPSPATAPQAASIASTPAGSSIEVGSPALPSVSAVEASAIEKVVSRVVNTVVEAIDDQEADSGERIAHLKAEIASLKDQRDDLRVRLNDETERRETAEHAYEFLFGQTAPLQLTVTKVRTSAKMEALAQARALRKASAIFEGFISSLADDIRRHFGFVPLQIANKLDEVARDVDVSGFLTEQEEAGEDVSFAFPPK